MTAAVILAAGTSTRLGEPKQLIRIAGETLLDRTVRTAHAAGCSPVVVVLGAFAARIQQACSLEDAVVLINPYWEEGMASSLRQGIAAVATQSATIVMTCDMPGVTAAHLRALMASGQLTASRYAGRNGVPAYFPASSFPALMMLQGDTGARSLLHEAAHIDYPGGEMDLDTPEDLKRLRAILGE